MKSNLHIESWERPIDRRASLRHAYNMLTRNGAFGHFRESRAAALVAQLAAFVEFRVVTRGNESAIAGQQRGFGHNGNLERGNQVRVAGERCQTIGQNVWQLEIG